MGRNGEWRVNVRDIDTGEVVHTVWCRTKHLAEKVEQGMNINMNHGAFYTEVADRGEFHTE